MSNLGLELALRREGIEFLRAKVGDRYVLEMLRKHGGVLGGETSGHLLCLDRTTTGDGLVSALQVLAVMKQHRPLARRAGRRHAAVPAGDGQRARCASASTRGQSPAIQAAVRRVEAALGDDRAGGAARLGHRAR